MTADVEGGSNRALRNLSRIRVLLLMVGVLFLVAVQGLILGVATREMEWGIARSGAIVSVVGVFVGLYHRHHK